MQKITYLLILSLMFSSCNNDVKEPTKLKIVDGLNENWNELISDDNSFKVLFPNGNIKKGNDKYFNDYDEELTNTYYRLNLQKQENLNLGYSVSFTSFPEIETSSEINELYIDHKNYLIDALNAELHYNKVLDSTNISGRELYMSIDSSKVKSTFRMHFKNGKLFMLHVLTEDNKGKIINKSIAKFMDSFEFIDN